MKEYGRERQLHVIFINEGEGNIKDFNSNQFALRIANELFPKAMNGLADKIGRADLAALQCTGSVLLTDAPCFGGTIKSAEAYLSDADIFFTKVPAIPKAGDMMEYENVIDDCPYLFKALPFGCGYHTNYACLEIGVQLRIQGAIKIVGALTTIYRVRHYHQEFVDSRSTLETIAGKTEYGHRNAPRDLFDLFGCCLKICRGDIKKARQMQRSSYVSWGCHAITKSALDQGCSEYAKLAD
ncbi:MAG: hypothetical protein WCT16_04685 [Candidatus Buchananbacteria bacterium]